MGAVEGAVRRTYRAPATLHTISRQAPFVLQKLDRAQIVLLLGEQRTWTPLRWEWVETIVPFLRARSWVRVGGAHSVAGEPGTLDQHMKQFLKRDVARWLSVILRDAGVLEVSERPLSVRLTSCFRS